MKKWKCTVCGYIHTGEEPPDKCPVCGAGKSKFVEFTQEETEAPPVEAAATEKAVTVNKYSKAFEAVKELASEFHIHPISVHVPNGVLPISVIFIVLNGLFGLNDLEQAAFYNMIFVLLAMPLVLFTGWVDWQKRYGGHLTRNFLVKMICGGVVFLLSLILVVWRLTNPAIMTPGSPHSGLYVFLSIVLVAAAGVAGYIGGKLVFNNSNG